MRLAAFIERDGVLNRVRVERHHQVTPLALDDFRLNLAAAPSLQLLRDAGFLIIATTNQPGLSRGYQSRRLLDQMHQRLARELPVDDVLLCPHDETDQCPCRKPKAGLLFEARYKWQLDLDRSYVISDKWQDAQAALTAGCTSLLIDSPWRGQGHHDLVLPDLPRVVAKLLDLHHHPRLLVG